MNSFKVEGIVKEIYDIRVIRYNEGEIKAVDFLMEDSYGDLYYFTLFGDRKVAKFDRFVDIGSKVLVRFKVRTSEGDSRMFSSLTAIRVWSIRDRRGATENPNITYEQY